MLALGYDDHPDVAVSIGFASSKLGRLDDAKRWYEKALTADPNHLSALGSYGLLRVQQGDVAERASRSGKDQDAVWRRRPAENTKSWRTRSQPDALASRLIGAV